MHHFWQNILLTPALTYDTILIFQEAEAILEEINPSPLQIFASGVVRLIELLSHLDQFFLSFCL